MPNQALFHPRTLRKALEQQSFLQDGQLPAAALKTLTAWHTLISNGSIHQQNEKKLQPEFFRDIAGTILGYKSFTQKDKKTGQWTLGYEEHSGKGFTDLCFGVFSDKHRQRLAPLELKGTNTRHLNIPMNGPKLSAVQQAAQYAENSKGEARWYMVSNCLEIRLYKYPFSNLIYESWQITDLIQPAEYERFMLLLSAKNLLSGTTEKLFEQSQQAEKDITDELYADYRDIRVKLINGMKRENARFSRQSMVTRAQTLLDRILFIAFAEDRDLLPHNTLQTYLNAKGQFDSSWDMLKRLFQDINEGNKKRHIPYYNGDLFKPDSALEELTLSDGLLDELRRLVAYDFNTDVNVTILGHIFEQSIADLDQIYEALDENNELQLAQQKHGTSGKRKQDGVVYTPDFITHWIVQHTLGAYLTQRQTQIQHATDSLAWWQQYRDTLATLRILDPACGSGAFLVAAFQYLKQEYTRVNQRLSELGESNDLFSKQLNHDILHNNLFGVDINAESVEIARLSLHLATAEKGKPLTSLRENIKQGNSLIDDKTTDKRAFNWFGRFKEFDVILGNPPYVRQERLTPIKPYLETHYKTYHGVADLYTYFFERGLSLLKKSGMLGYISSGTFFRTGSGENLRRFLTIEANLKTLVDFGDLQIFEGVTTYPAILIMEKPSRSRKNAPEHTVQFRNIQAKDLTALQTELTETVFSTIAQHKLADDGWRLEDERLQALRNKISKGKPTLKEVYGSPYRGLLTGLNEAFVIDKKMRDSIIKHNPQSLERLKPFLEGKDLKQWRAESRDLYLILFPKGWTRQQMGKTHEIVTESDAWQWLQQKHPQICQWLAPFAEKGRKRGDKGEYWWELRACSYYSSFENDKLIYVDIGDKPSFHFKKNSGYCANTAYFIPNGDYFLCGLLNSNTFWYFITGKTNSIRGGFYRLFTQHMDSTPIPKATETQKSAIAALAQQCQTIAEQRYALENHFRRRIPDLCPKDKEAKLSQKLQAWWEMDFTTFQSEVKKSFKQDIPFTERHDWQTLFEKNQASIQQLSYELTITEQELNQAVYTLFGLDEAEIQLLKSSSLPMANELK